MSLAERWRRWLCRNFGHVFKLDDRGAPVIPVFAVCSRCGKFERVIR